MKRNKYGIEFDGTSEYKASKSKDQALRIARKFVGVSRLYKGAVFNGDLGTITEYWLKPNHAKQETNGFSPVVITKYF